MWYLTSGLAWCDLDICNLHAAANTKSAIISMALMHEVWYDIWPPAGQHQLKWPLQFISSSRERMFSAHSTHSYQHTSWKSHACWAIRWYFFALQKRLWPVVQCVVIRTMEALQRLSMEPLDPEACMRSAYDVSHCNLGEHALPNPLIQ